MEKQIWDFLKAEGFSDFGVAGLMGNLLAESGLRPNNMEDQYQSKLGYNDDSYTRAVDNGTYTNLLQMLLVMAWRNGHIGLENRVF